MGGAPQAPTFNRRPAASFSARIAPSESGRTGPYSPHDRHLARRPSPRGTTSMGRGCPHPQAFGFSRAMATLLTACSSGRTYSNTHEPLGFTTVNSVLKRDNFRRTPSVRSSQNTTPSRSYRAAPVVTGENGAARGSVLEGASGRSDRSRHHLRVIHREGITPPCGRPLQDRGHAYFGELPFHALR